MIFNPQISTSIIFMDLTIFMAGITSFYNSQGNIRDFFKIGLSILDVLVGVGMITSWPKVDHAGPPQVLPVLLDGRVIGSLPSGQADKVVAHLRRLKVSAASVVCFSFPLCNLVFIKYILKFMLCIIDS